MKDPKQKRVERLGAKVRKSAAKDYAKSNDHFADSSPRTARKVEKFMKAVEKRDKKK